jgi:hypothetical protein
MPRIFTNCRIRGTFTVECNGEVLFTLPESEDFSTPELSVGQRLRRDGRPDVLDDALCGGTEAIAHVVEAPQELDEVARGLDEHEARAAKKIATGERRRGAARVLEDAIREDAILVGEVIDADGGVRK